MSLPAADDFDTIRRRVAELRQTEKPRCPNGRYALLGDCLRSFTHCPADCPFAGDWIGPQQ
jgi:hypothetical protein